MTWNPDLTLWLISMSRKSPATDSHKPTGIPSFFAKSNQLPNK